jgi:small-conductance mechanosensitive channel
MGTYGHQGGYAFNEDQRGGHHPGIFEMSAEIDRLTQRLAESEARVADRDQKNITLYNRLIATEARLAAAESELATRGRLQQDMNTIYTVANLQQRLAAAEEVIREGIRICEWMGKHNDVLTGWEEQAKGFEVCKFGEVSQEYGAFDVKMKAMGYEECEP